MKIHNSKSGNYKEASYLWVFSIKWKREFPNGLFWMWIAALFQVLVWEFSMLFFSIYYWPLLPFFSFCTMAHVFIYCAPHPFRERVFQTPTMRGMIRTGIIFIATQTLSNSALPHIQNKGILKEKYWTIEFERRYGI